MSLDVTRFSAEHEMPIDTANQVADIFGDNYPSIHSEASRDKDIQRRKNGSEVLELLNKGRTFYVAKDNDAVAGFLEARLYEQDTVTNELLTWLMTSQSHRGIGVASRLHDMFIQDAILSARKRAPRATRVLLGVHDMNSARNVYDNWGYEEQGRPDNDPHVILMSRPIPIDL